MPHEPEGRDEAWPAAKAGPAKAERAGRLSAEEAENLPNRLLDAAAALFLEKGYAKATMEGVARAAQASTKTVYSRFDNKGEILAAVIRRLVEQTAAQLTAEVDAMVEGSEPRAFLHELGSGRDLIETLNIWARFIYRLLMDDRGGGRSVPARLRRTTVTGSGGPLRRRPVNWRGTPNPQANLTLGCHVQSGPRCCSGPSFCANSRALDLMIGGRDG